MKRATEIKRMLEEIAYHFNPRPREEGDGLSFGILNLPSHFNPRPREEGDVKTAGSKSAKHFISIHALVKRATGVKPISAVYTTISIHALVKRATNGILLTPTEHRYFNPRPREEGDL